MKKNEEIDLREHFGLVGMITNQFVRLQLGQSLEETEEWGDGIIGLVQAKNSFNPKLGWQFSTLAVKCIRNAILRGKTYRSRHFWPELSLDFEVDDGANLYDLLPAKDKEQIELEDMVEVILDLLDEKLSYVLRRRIMDEVILKDVGKELGVGRERIRQLEDEGLKKAKKVCKRIGLEHACCY